jgi:hypothetical protein
LKPHIHQNGPEILGVNIHALFSVGAQEF